MAGHCDGSGERDGLVRRMSRLWPIGAAVLSNFWAEAFPRRGRRVLCHFEGLMFYKASAARELA